MTKIKKWRISLDDVPEFVEAKTYLQARKKFIEEINVFEVG